MFKLISAELETLAQQLSIWDKWHLILDDLDNARDSYDELCKDFLIEEMAKRLNDEQRVIINKALLKKGLKPRSHLYLKMIDFDIDDLIREIYEEENNLKKEIQNDTTTNK